MSSESPSPKIPKMTVSYMDPGAASDSPLREPTTATLDHARFSELLQAPGGEDRPVSPNMAAMMATTGKSPHRFAASALLFEMEPRSRPNKFVSDEAGCVDMSSPVDESANEPRLATPGTVDVAQVSALVGGTPGTPTGDSLAFVRHSSFLGGSFPAASFDEEDETHRANLDAVMRRLRSAMHLSMLPADELEHLARHVTILTPKHDDVLLAYGDVCTGCYVIMRGRVAVFRPSRTVAHEFDSRWWLSTGDMFGFDYVVLGSQSSRKFQVMTEDAVVAFFDYHTLFKLIRHNPGMAQSMARKLAEDMAAFRPFKEYARAVFAPTTDPEHNVVSWNKVLDKFGKINNGIYPEMHAKELDTGAWTYALRRLPDNTTHSLVVELGKAPPPMMASLMRKLSREYDANPDGDVPVTEDGRVSYVGCKVRRRASYQMGNGKTLVILRDSTTDLIDFISCMCVHINESEKLRNRLVNQTDPALIPGLQDKLHLNSLDDVRDALRELPFSDKEREGLVNLWKHDTIRNIIQIVSTRRDDLLVRVDMRSFRRFYRTPAMGFAHNIKREILRRLGLPEDGDLPPNLIVDIISSNAHSVKNLLSNFPRKNRARIMQFAREHCAKDVALNWHNSEDLLYYVMSKMVASDDEVRHSFTSTWIESGLTSIALTSMTGLEVDIVDVRDIDVEHVDTLLGDAARSATERLQSPYAGPHFIINLDFPFGHQAESIMKSLSHCLGFHVRSMNVMGKAGALTGRRGDIQFPTHVLFSKSAVPYDDFVDELRPTRQHDLSAEDLQLQVGTDRQVHVGPVVTIAGTMMQNSKLLRYYRNLWGCVGMEMEGSYFARALMEGVEQRVLRPDLKTRFLYYTSDTPLASAEESLAAGMTPTEGVPSLYAVTRAFLRAILSDQLGAAE